MTLDTRIAVETTRKLVLGVLGHDLRTAILDDLIDTDIAAIEAELQALQTAPTPTEKKQKPKRTALPAEFHAR